MRTNPSSSLNNVLHTKKIKRFAQDWVVRLLENHFGSSWISKTFPHTKKKLDNLTQPTATSSWIRPCKRILWQPIEKSKYLNVLATSRVPILNDLREKRFSNNWELCLSITVQLEPPSVLASRTLLKETHIFSR